MSIAKAYNRSKAEFINSLPTSVYEIRFYINACFGPSLFNRYWWDYINNRIIMKPKRGNRYKIVHPMVDKRDNSKFAHLYDIENRLTFVNYDYLTFSHSTGYYLSIESYDYVVESSKEIFHE